MDDNFPILLVEGQSDTWIMEYMFGRDYAIVGFPGASQNPSKILVDIPLRDRKIIIAFDGDNAGDLARENLADYLHQEGADVWILPMYHNRDCADLTENELLELMENWQSPYQPSLHMTVLDGSYYRIGSQGATGLQVSSWVLNLERLYISDQPGLYGYSGTINANNRKFKLLSTQFTMTGIKDWCRVHNLSWIGNATDIEKLAALLRQQAMFVPVARMTTRVGLHEGTFVWPQEKIGRGEWTYIPPDIGVDMSQSLNLSSLPTREKVDEVMTKLIELSDKNITVPILSWLAVCPLRPLFERFPVLHISGMSGSGKTTLTQVMTYMFSGSMGLNYTLTSTTPYGISMMFEATNNLPIWFDEYRWGARIDSKMFLDQCMRDAYTGQSSVRGDVATKGQKVTHFRTDTPIILTGEDTITERSHLDRSIVLHLTARAQNPEALEYFNFQTPINRSYLDFLVKNGHTREPILTQPLSLEGGFTSYLSDRQLRNMWVLRYGNFLLNEWLSSIGSQVVVPPMQWEDLIDNVVGEVTQEPLSELIEWALDMNHTNAVVLKDGLIVIHPTELMRLSMSHLGPPINLPFSNGRALTMHLIDSYGAKVGMHPSSHNSERMIRVYTMEIEKVFPLLDQ